MMRMLRAVFGCSHREAAYDENWQRDRRQQAEMHRKIEEQARRAARESEAARRLLDRLQEDLGRW